MPQTQDLFSDHPGNLILPRLVYGPKKYPIGHVFQVLRSGCKVKILKEENIKISPRVSERCLHLDNGEKILLTTKKKLERPVGVHGILRETESKEYEWLSHQLIDEVPGDDLSSLSSTAAEGWQDSVRYRAEKNPIQSSSDTGFRPPQIGAIFSVGAHWSLSNGPATIIMPTGTGKTETMLAVQAANQIKRLLVAVPSKALRSQIAEKFMSFGMLRDLGVLSHECSNPVVGILHRRPKSVDELDMFKNCNVVVGVVSSLSGGTASLHLNDVADIMDALIVDEAHHVAAKTWNEIREAFSGKPILQFTATPFRNDGKLVDGNVIYSYPLKAAQKDGYFKEIDFIPIHNLSYEDADEEIAQAAVDRLDEDLINGYSHQLIARCRSKERAEEIFEIYQRIAPTLRPQLIHSEIKDADDRVERVRSGESKIVVCVNMLGEGIDIPTLKVAALHDTHQSLAVLLQFVGRITRKGGGNLGNASVVANIADPSVSGSLEQLYSEDADWNALLREMSSSAVKEHAEFIQFLENSTPFEVNDEDIPGVSQSSIRPIFSTLFFRCSEFHPKRFHEGFPDRYKVVRVWLNSDTNTLYFVTRSTERVKWSRAKEVEQLEWHLFVLHYDAELSLLYLASTNKSSNHEVLAKAVGANLPLGGEDMFRALGGIGRLVFNNLGVTKHGRRNLSFAMYTGADVKQALSETEKKGSRKSNISGYGWENGEQITIGCSYKGRVWSKAAGTIPQFVKWAHGVGAKLIDETIDTKSVIANVLIPEYANSLPEYDVLTIDWPSELLSQSEDRVTIKAKAGEYELFRADIVCTAFDRDRSTVDFTVLGGEELVTLGEFRLVVKGEEGFDIVCLSEEAPLIGVGQSEISLTDYFENYPPLIRFVDLSELDGNILLRSEDAGTVEVQQERLEAWDWDDTDIKIESIWKNGKQRTNSIQWRTAQHFIDGGFTIVYDDDGAGEAADLVCLKMEEDHIRLILVHCKFSGAEKEGRRIKDVVEVASQAIRSARWPGKLKSLAKHIEHREKRHKENPDRTGFLAGGPNDLTALVRASRFKEVRPEILIVQPGVSKSKLSTGQSVVLGAAAAYLKQTLDIDLDIICGN